MSNLSRRAFLGSSAAVASSMLAACAGQEKPAQSSDKNSASSKITFVLDYTPNTNHTGIYVAHAKGYFKDAGIELEIVQPSENGAEAMLGSGEAQLGVSYQDYIANVLASDNPMPVEALAAIIQHNTSGIMSRKADGITRARAMEDHVYATWDLPVEQATIKQIIEADGGDFSKLKMVAYAVDDEVSGLKANMFDCVWVYEGWAVQNAIVQKYDVNYFSFMSMDEVFDFYTPVIAGNSEWCKKNPDLTKAFIAAVKKGYEFAVNDPEAAADILLEQVPELDAALVKQSQLYLKDQYIADAKSWGEIDKDRWSRYYQWLNDKKLVEHEIDPNSGYNLDYLA